MELSIKLLLTIVVVYLLLSQIIHNTIFFHSPVPYYNYLIEALLKGRFNIHYTDNFIDLSFFNGKYYLYWGPAPILFITPFYLLLGGRNASDGLYTITASLLNIIFFSILIKEFIRYFKVAVSPLSSQIILASFALASPNIFLAMGGGVWFTAQSIAMTYILLALIFYFRFLNNPTGKLYLALSVLFFNLAWLSRFGMTVYVLLYFYLFHEFKNKKFLYKSLFTLVLSITAVFVFVFFIYNFLRFGNIFEVGSQHMLVDWDFIQKNDFVVEMKRLSLDFKQGKTFSVTNIPRNIFYYFLNPIKFSSNAPYLISDRNGNSIFFTYPTLIFLFVFFKRNILKDLRKKILLFTMSLIAVIYIISLLLYTATGWSQFGSRYVFDIIPLILLMILLIFKYIPSKLQYAVVIYGVFINILGVLVYYTWGIIR